jgi:hypothetical protein
MTRFTVLLILAVSAHGGWIIDQHTGYDESIRILIGESGWKETRGEEDLIVDFAEDMVFRVDNRTRTIAKISLDRYLEKEAAGRRHEPEKANGPDRIGGVACLRFQSVYKPGANNGAEACVTRAIRLAAPYEQKLDAWLRATQAFGDRGFLIWMKTQTGGPWRVTRWTTHAVQREILREEFYPPTGYHAIPFTFD